MDALIDGVLELLKEHPQKLREQLLKGFDVFVPAHHRRSYRERAFGIGTAASWTAASGVSVARKDTCSPLWVLFAVDDLSTMSQLVVTIVRRVRSELCELKPSDCYFAGEGGTVYIDGVAVLMLGTISLGGRAGIRLSNRKHYSRVLLWSARATIELDYVRAFV
eukprot:scaffold1074_cov409-Prasinococcus_capsulatus_cf.AAC.21